ncbi:MAG: hypothetical protein NTW02_10925 [Cyanobium sp. LacPavin_0920_WC12_MAG_62_9]|nr:hypothetical protein [Cyanobium sp. LacPavin_0920_WC12_MAG_62_9]
MSIVAAGAIPGALLRWQLETMGHHWVLVSMLGGLLAVVAGFGVMRLGERAFGSGRGGFR